LFGPLKLKILSLSIAALKLSSIKYKQRETLH
jgi:hypothetical protein